MTTEDTNTPMRSVFDQSLIETNWEHISNHSNLSSANPNILENSFFKEEDQDAPMIGTIGSIVEQKQTN